MSRPASNHQALHLSGPIILAPDDVRGEGWVVGGKLTFSPPMAPTVPIQGWVLPGLVDLHCHVGLGPGGAVDLAQARRQALADRDAGTLLIRDAGAPIDTHALDDDPALPRIIRAGRHIARPKRYLRYFATEIEASELPSVALAQLAAGDGWVKLIADWIDRSEGAGADLRPLWSPDLLGEAITAVHRAGGRVTAHTFSTEAIADLLTAGVDCLEHGTGLNADTMRVVAERGIPVVATLLQVGEFERIAESARGKYEVYAAGMRARYARRYDQVNDMYSAGIRILAGTDAGGTIKHGSLPAEIAELVRAGLPPIEAIGAGCWYARDFLGRPPLAEGADADLVVYPGDPRADIRLLADPTAVIVGGEPVRPSARPT